jgi:hypothetical protein
LYSVLLATKRLAKWAAFATVAEWFNLNSDMASTAIQRINMGRELY